MRVAATITVTGEQCVTLQRWARGRSTPVRLMQRARMIRMAVDGKDNKEIAKTLGVQPSTVGRWGQRFAKSGLAGIEKDAPRGVASQRNSVNGPNGSSRPPFTRRRLTRHHWSIRTLSEHVGIRPTWSIACGRPISSNRPGSVL